MAEKRLTREIAEQFLADEDSVDLDEFTELDDDAAESLSKHEGNLELNGLTSLSDAAAECLARHAGNSLSLGGYAEPFSLSGGISPTAVLHLTEYMGSL